MGAANSRSACPEPPLSRCVIAVGAPRQPTSTPRPDGEGPQRSPHLELALALQQALIGG